jgi:hypothetical protein
VAMTEDRAKNRNEDKPWSDIDLFDLQSNIARGDLVEETAELLMRREGEVREKIRELRLKARTSI